MIEVINAIKQATTIPIYPLQSDKLGEQIIYIPTPISDNGCVNVYRLQLNIIGKSLANVESYDKAIRTALLNIGDTNKVNNINKIEVNGGGTLTSELGVHRFIYLIITERSL